MKGIADPDDVDPDGGGQPVVFPVQLTRQSIANCFE
jgi:hypothetical protein